MSDYEDKQRKLVSDLQAENAALRSMLRRLEYMNNGTGNTRCPMCGMNPHDARCELAAILKGGA